MGEDARWVCHTCKTVCFRGGEPYLNKHLNQLDDGDLVYAKTQLAILIATTGLDHLKPTYDYFSDLVKWTSNHIGHTVHFGSDVTTDHMDLNDYRIESIAGVKSELTIGESANKAYTEWRRAKLEETKNIISLTVTSKLTVEEASEKILNLLEYAEVQE